jgi:O-antigen ligase
LRDHAVVNISLPRAATEAFLPYTSFVVILAMLFGGGGNQGWSDALVQLAALPLLAWAFFKISPSQLDRQGQWAIVLLCAILAWPLLQLIPLPPYVWSNLPGRGAIASAYQAAGMPLPWLPISLNPSGTWLGLLSLLPATAIFLAILSLERPSRRVLVVLVFVVVSASVVLDVLQMMADPTTSSLWFYTNTNRGRGVGFFANANHNAAFLYSAIPFVAAWAIGLTRDRSRNRTIHLVLLLSVILMTIIGVTAARSRAGLVLFFVAGLSSLLLFWRQDRGQSNRRLLLFGIGASFAALLLAFQFGFVGFMQRVEEQGIEDLRWQAAGVTFEAAVAHLPFGSGFGTFVPVYETFAPRTLLSESYVNHAHNDWLELWLTGGIPAILLAFAFLAWLAASTVRLWRSDELQGSVLDLALERAAPIVILLLLLHSAVDYPLRIPALSVLFAIACAFLIYPPIKHPADPERLVRGKSIKDDHLQIRTRILP